MQGIRGQGDTSAAHRSPCSRRTERRRHPPRRTPGQTECASAGTSFTASATMGGLWRQAGWITAELRNASTGAGRGEERGGRNQCPGESAPRLPLLLQLRTCSPAQCFLELFLLVRNSGLRRPCCVIPNALSSADAVGGRLRRTVSEIIAPRLHSESPPKKILIEFSS